MRSNARNSWFSVIRLWTNFSVPVCPAKLFVHSPATWGSFTMRSQRRDHARKLSTKGHRATKSGRSHKRDDARKWKPPRTYTVDDDDIFESRQFFAEQKIRLMREERDREKFLKQARINENNAPFYIDPDDPFDIKGQEEEERRLQEEFLRELENDDMPEEPRRRRRRRSRYGITVFSSDEDDEHWDIDFRTSEAKRETKEVKKRLAEAEAKLKRWEEKGKSDLQKQQKWEKIEEETRRETERYTTGTFLMIGDMEEKEEQLEEDLNRLWFTIGEDEELKQCWKWIKTYEDLIQRKEDCLRGQNEKLLELSERELAGPAILKGEAKMLTRDEETLKSKVSEQDCVIAELLAILEEAGHP